MHHLQRYAGMLALALACHGPALAAPDARIQAEITHLLDYVATPGCQFNRNGSWYDGTKARAHLQEKYDYLVKRKLVTDAESFIARAASESSMSHKPYQVKCGNGRAVDSSVYLKEELARFRARGGK